MNSDVDRGHHTRIRATRPFNRRMPAVAEGLRPAFRHYLLRRCLDWGIAERNGWYPSIAAADDYPRIVIPATASEGNVFWQARQIYDYPEGPRYQSPHAPRGDAVVVVWPRGKVNHAVVAEGPMDALAAAGTGCVGIALMGVTPNIEALRAVRRLVKVPVTVVADADAPGPMVVVMHRLIDLGLGCRLVLPTPFKDLAEAPPEERKRILQ